MSTKKDYTWRQCIKQARLMGWEYVRGKTDPYIKRSVLVKHSYSDKHNNYYRRLEFRIYRNKRVDGLAFIIDTISSYRQGLEQLDIAFVALSLSTEAYQHPSETRMTTYV